MEIELFLRVICRGSMRRVLNNRLSLSNQFHLLWRRVELQFISVGFVVNREYFKIQKRRWQCISFRVILIVCVCVCICSRIVNTLQWQQSNTKTHIHTQHRRRKPTHSQCNDTRNRESTEKNRKRRRPNTKENQRKIKRTRIYSDTMPGEAP